MFSGPSASEAFSSNNILDLFNKKVKSFRNPSSVAVAALALFLR